MAGQDRLQPVRAAGAGTVRRGMPAWQCEDILHHKAARRAHRAASRKGEGAWSEASCRGGGAPGPPARDRVARGHQIGRATLIQSLMRISYAVFCLKNKI